MRAMVFVATAFAAEVGRGSGDCGGGDGGGGEGGGGEGGCGWCGAGVCCEGGGDGGISGDCDDGRGSEATAMAAVVREGAGKVVKARVAAAWVAVVMVAAARMGELYVFGMVVGLWRAVALITFRVMALAPLLQLFSHPTPSSRTRLAVVGS